MKKRLLVSLLLFGLLFVAFNAAFICFIASGQINIALSWILFAFTNLLIIEGFIATALAIKTEKLGHRVYSLPIVIWASVIVFASAISSIVCFAINASIEVKPFIAIIISIITFVAFHALMIVHFAHKESIIAVEKNEEKVDDLFIKEMRKKSNNLLSKYKKIMGDEKLRVLKETFDYASPYTVEANIDVENKISDSMNALENSLLEGDVSYSSQIIDEIIILLKERENNSIK